MTTKQKPNPLDELPPKPRSVREEMQRVGKLEVYESIVRRYVELQRESREPRLVDVLAKIAEVTGVTVNGSTFKGHVARAK